MGDIYDVLRDNDESDSCSATELNGLRAQVAGLTADRLAYAEQLDANMRDISALREQLRGTANRLRLAEEAMLRAMAERDGLKRIMSDFIATAKGAGVR